MALILFMMALPPIPSQRRLEVQYMTLKGHKYSISCTGVENINRTHLVPIKHDKRRIPNWKQIIVLVQLIK